VQSRLREYEATGKSDKSPVTVADFGSQAIVAYTLQKEMPDKVSLVAEETSESISCCQIDHACIEIVLQGVPSSEK